MSDDIFVECCAPTLAGIKTGSLFSCPYDSREELLSTLRRLNLSLGEKGLRLLPMRYSDTHVLLYLYRPDRLGADLSCREAADILSSAGYSGLNTAQHVSMLIKKLRSGEGFPHEIGLFLSYPPEDVKGFIENKAHNYKFTGFWKVYGDEDKARRTFEKYRKCTDCYRRMFEAGFSLEQLAVAV